MRIELVQADITTQKVDAIVNAANSSLLGGGGVDGVIHLAGGPDIIEECRSLRQEKYPEGLPVGDAVVTTAGALPARWVIHTVGPVFVPHEDHSHLLRSCYGASIALADELGATKIAFPLISAGAYGWPEEDAIRQALRVLRAATSKIDEARLVLHRKETYEKAQRIAGEFRTLPQGANAST